MTALPINIDELLKGQIVEWERLEFKKGWNPEEMIHTICAFANDINNWGGGYLIIGVEEVNGEPSFPPAGLRPKEIDEIQKELVNLSYKLRPNYHPIVAPVTFQDKLILLVWCPGGQTRPYQAPDTLGKSAPYSYYVRRNSTTVKAQTKDVHRLYELANQVPFDDRINHQADISDLEFGLIKDFLREVKSDLIKVVDQIPFDQLCHQMQLIQGPEEYVKPLNIGLMMFNSNPEKFFPYARIEVVDFHDDVGDSFSEKIFKGPIHLQLRAALKHIDSILIREEVRKRDDRPEADRFYNYPIVALEEALANAVYHKNYGQREPIEVSIKSDRILILSFPGPIPPITIEDVKNGAAQVRTYRNRRIGDFLKELHMTEGRCTGVPKIKRAMKKNGSPPPIFETDEECRYFLTTLLMHPEATRRFNEKNKTPQLEVIITKKQLPKELLQLLKSLGNRPSDKAVRYTIQKLCSWQPMTPRQLLKLLNKKDKKHLVRSYLTPMIKEGVLKYLFPEDEDSPFQAYMV
jgi:ATP-dependent DNA helicase RecG